MESISLQRKLHSLHFYAVLLGTLWFCTSTASEEYGRIARKLSSPFDGQDLLDGSQLSNEDLHSLLSILEARQRAQEEASTPRVYPTIHPELIRNHENVPSPSPSPTSTTERTSPSSRVTRRIYRRLRRKPTTQSPAITSSTTAREDVGGGRMLPQTGPGELLNQLSLLNGILVALNSTSEPSAAPSPTTNAPVTSTQNIDLANDPKDNSTSIHELLAILTGAKSEASSKSEVVVPPPPQPSSSPSQVDDNTANALALLNLFSGGNDKEGAGSNSGATANLLNLMSQSHSQQQAPSPVSDADATAALTKLLLQSSGQSGQSMQSNSIQQTNAEQSANQLSSLLGLLGTLGNAAGAGGGQSNAGNINNLFNLGGDQQTAQAQNALANLFGGNPQQQQNQNLLNLFGGNQANQGFNLASLLAPQAGGNSIPGLGLLSTMSSLGSSIFSTVSNLFGSGGQGGKPRVRGKGVDTRLGLGYRMGNVGDAQIVWDIGPQLFTDPLRNELRPFTKKRESGSPASVAPSYLAPSLEKEVQQTEAKRRMVQSAIHDHYRNDYDHQFSGIYPQKYRRSHSHFDYPPATSTRRPYYYSSTTSSTPPPSSGFFSSGFSLPFVDHVKGFWSGLTSGVTEAPEETTPGYYNFDEIRDDFSTNLIKRSSPDYGAYEGRSYHQHQRRRQDDYETEDEQNHSTLTDYERMLLQYGKDMGVGGVADTRNGVVEEPTTSQSSIFDRWFGKSSTESPSSDEQSYRRDVYQSHDQRKEWGPGSATSGSNEYPVVRKPQKKTTSYGHDGSFKQRNDHPRRSKNRTPRPQQRRSHNPFRNWLSALKPASHHHNHHHNHHSHNHNHPQGQRPRSSSSQHSHYAGFGRRHYKRPGGNPKLQHFTNTNKDLMMADANLDDFVASAGAESLPGAYDQTIPMSYNYAGEFPDVPLSLPPRRLRPSEMPSMGYGGKVKASHGHRDHIVEPALLYDHLEVKDDSKPPSEADESFHQRNKVVVNPKLKEIEKQKVLGTAPLPTRKVSKAPVSLSKIQLQRMRLNKLRGNGTGEGGKHKIIVKVKGKGSHGQYKSSPIQSLPLHDQEDGPESSTALPSVLSTISSMFSPSSKPKLIQNFIQNATSYLPSIRILPRKKKKDPKMKFTLINGKPAVLRPPTEEGEDDDDQDTEAAELPPVIHLGEEMSFGDLQSVFAASANSTKRRRFRIRVKESVLKGETPSDKPEDSDKERKDSDSEDSEEAKDIFVDIESGEVSVLKPVASLVSFDPKKEEPSQEEIDYYEDDDGDGVPDHDMKRKEHIFDAIQKQLVGNFEKMKKAEAKAEAKKRRKEELAQKGMDESMDQVMTLFDYHQDDKEKDYERSPPKPKFAGGLPL